MTLTVIVSSICQPTAIAFAVSPPCPRTIVNTSPAMFVT
jgi:hypothetical protein